MKLHRLLAITMLLLSKKRITGHELADRFEVSLRTIYRDLDTINGAGIPIAAYSGADGGYEIMEQYRIDKQMVTADELSSIATALKGMQSSLDDRGMDRLLEKVGALLAKSEKSRGDDAAETLLLSTGTWTNRDRDKSAIPLLRQAAKERQAVRFAYTKLEGEQEERTVEPIGLAWKGYAWYLYAYCRLRRDYRVYRLSRIKDLQVLPERFARHDVTLEALDEKWSRHDPQENVQLVLRFHPRSRIRVEEYFGEEAIRVEEDGSLLVRAEQPENQWLYGMLLSYGPHLKILEPKRIADIVKDQAKEIIALYEN